MAKTGVEIHCPNCGTLIREVKLQRNCPDCNNQQAIFLPFSSSRTTYEDLIKYNQNMLDDFS